MTAVVGSRTLSGTVCRDADGFALLAEEWESLRGRSRSATAFQSHAWLYSWWLSYGSPGRLRVVLVRQGGRLVAAAPMMLTHRPLPALVALGGGITDFCDVLLDDDCPQAPAALARGVRRAARGAVVDLREVRPGAAVERLYESWQGPRRRRTDSSCLELPGVPIEALLDRLATASARRTRQKLRKIDKLGVEERTVTAGDSAAAVRTMLRLHRLQWQDRAVTPEHLTSRFHAHLERALPTMVRNGDAVVTEYRVGEDVVATDVSFAQSDLVCGYLYGADPRLREQRIDIAVMLLRHDLDFTARTGRRAMSLLRGTEPYKLRWKPYPVVNQRFLLASRGMTPALKLYAGQIAARQHAAEAVRSRASLARMWALHPKAAPVPAPRPDTRRRTMT
ncbi:GNAT family N-acetyltransferase [Streptomyces sulphureus]|uniref:GNAT family N-acetyltransferase n=1 Tax=Streptomyces sulphureus TaxID=47758 RepID=UPI00037CED44|nr:GNAT family N-acetyltransferase [Streptomyces sulphureus]